MCLPVAVGSFKSTSPVNVPPPTSPPPMMPAMSAKTPARGARAVTHLVKLIVAAPWLSARAIGVWINSVAASAASVRCLIIFIYCLLFCALRFCWLLQKAGLVTEFQFRQTVLPLWSASSALFVGPLLAGEKFPVPNNTSCVEVSASFNQELATDRDLVFTLTATANEAPSWPGSPP